MSREEYIERYKHIAIDHQHVYGIPASITMAQGILESDSGNSTLARGSNNHFGIKCKGTWTGKTFTYTDDAPDECFRAYSSVEESYEDHAKFLDESPRYDSLFDFRSDDYRSWARGLKSAGYATAPHYTTMLIKIIEDHKLYLLDSSAGAREYASRNQGVNKASDEMTMMNPNALSVSVYAYNGRDIREANKSIYILAREGDTYTLLAKEFGLSAKRLRRFNDEESEVDEITAGSPIFLVRKRSKWCGDDQVHEVRSGQTLHYVSQLFGVRQSSLRRMSRLKSGDEVSAGTMIYLQ